MDSGLKQRLVGAAVLVALAVIFLPMLVKGPAPDSGASDIPLQFPEEPSGGTITRELPLLAPAAPGAGGAVGMETPDGDEDRLATVDTADERHPDAAEPASDATAGDDTAQPEASAGTQGPALPATTAGGGYAVRFGSYGSSDDADAVVGRLRQADLPAGHRRATVADKPVWRVLIGPYATRAEAEAVRVHAAQVGPNDAQVVALDAAPAQQPQPAPPSPQASPERSAETAAASPTPAAAADVGFVVQLGAFSRGAEAEALRDRARAAGFSAFTDTVETDKGRLTRVKAGPVVSRAEAEQLKSRLQGTLGVAGMVRSHP